MLELELNNLSENEDNISGQDIMNLSSNSIIKASNKNINKSILGCSVKLKLTAFQANRINQYLGCIRKVKNNKISEINEHNKNYLNIDLYNDFKLSNPDIESKNNPYKYVYPDQSYARSKNISIDFVGPLTNEDYYNVYKNNKHYMERTPSILYRNSLKDLLDGNKKYIADVFNKNINYINKRKPLKFIKKNHSTESFLVTDSDNMFTIQEAKNQPFGKACKVNKICFGGNFDKSYKTELEIKTLTQQLNKKSTNKKDSNNDKINLPLLSDKEKCNLKKQIKNLQEKLDKDYSYLGVLNFILPKKNKTSKEIDYNSIKSIRIRRENNIYTMSFSFEYINSYTPTLLKLNSKEEITTKEELAYYIEGLSKQDPKLAIKYLEERVLGIDRGILERLALSASNNNLDNNSNLNSSNNFISYSEEIKLKIEQLNKKIKYHKRQLSRRSKSSRGYNKSLNRHKKLNKNLGNIRKEINHQISHVLIEDYNYPIIALEKLNLKGMTKKPMPKVNVAKSLSNKNNIKLNLDQFKLNEIVEKLTEFYKENKQGLKYKDIVGEYTLVFSKNKASAKAGLNARMLNQNHGQLSMFLEYKSIMHGKIVIEVNPQYSSQECSHCGNIDSENRIKTKFCCKSCGHKDHADNNASKVIASRVYKALLKFAIECRKKADIKKLKN